MPEVIDLLSSSPEPEPKKRRVEKEKRKSNDVARENVGTSKTARGGKTAEIRDEASRDSSRSSSKTLNVNDVAQALKTGWRFGEGEGSGVGAANGEGSGVKEIVKEKEVVKERDMTEAEKIRELRLKRFGGLSNTGSPSPSVASSPDCHQVAESTTMSAKMGEVRNSVDKSGGAGKVKGTTSARDTSLRGKTIPSSTKTDNSAAATMHSAISSKKNLEAASSAIDDSYGTFDFTLEDEDVLPAPTIHSRENQSRKSTTAKKVDHSDPFRSSSPSEMSAAPKVQPRTSAAASEAIVIDDDSDGIELPTAKRRRVSPEARTSTLSENGTGARAKGSGYRRTVSSVAQSGTDAKTKASGLKRSKTAIDEIEFTSSFDPLGYKKKKVDKGKGRAESDDGFKDIDDFSDEDPVGGRGGSMTKAESPGLFVTEDELEDSDLDCLPEVSQIPVGKSKPKKYTLQGKSTTTAATSPASKPKSSRAALSAYEKEKRAEKKTQEKKEKEAQKIAAKEEAKEKKRIEKENLAKKKEEEKAFAKVNTLKTNKASSTEEMIAILPTDLNNLLATSTKVLLEGLKVEVRTRDSPIPNVIRFKRKVKADYDPKTDTWIPIAKEISPEIRDEKHVLVIVTAKEFINLINGPEGKDLICHILQMKGKFENPTTVPGGSKGKNITYVIEGLSALLKQHKNAQNREFANKVRGESSKRKRKETADELDEIDEAKVEDALMEMQVIHGLLIHHTIQVETAQWIAVFTQHISTLPYRLANSLKETNVCLESGQTKSGSDASDTFIKMLQETQRLTAAVAYGIAGRYESATKLVEAYEEAESEKEAMGLLKNLRKGANANGSFNNGAIGPKLSERVWKVFMGTDEESMDV